VGRVFRVGFCGAGGIVRDNHLPALEARPDRYAVAGFYDVAAEASRKMAGTQYTAYATYADMLADPALDIVVIATRPLSTHLPAAREALAAGKHVVLEKPMASTARECDELIALARRQGRVLTVHHNRRLDLDFLALQEVIRQGKLGEVRLIENRVDGGYGGDFVDWGVHLVDQSLRLNRSPLREVSATFCQPAAGIGDCGFGETLFRFAEPPVVLLAMMPRPQEFLLNGTPAATRFYAAGTAAACVQRVIEDPRDLMNATQNFDKARPDYAVPSYLEIRRKEYYDFLYGSLAEGQPLLVRPEEARNAIRALELMELSARENRAVAATDMLQ